MLWGIGDFGKNCWKVFEGEVPFTNILLLCLNIGYTLLRLSVPSDQFSMYAKFFEKLTFLTPWYSHLGDLSGGKKSEFLWKICVRTEWMNSCYFDDSFEERRLESMTQWRKVKNQCMTQYEDVIYRARKGQNFGKQMMLKRFIFCEICTVYQEIISKKRTVMNSETSWWSPGDFIGKLQPAAEIKLSHDLMQTSVG